MITLAGLENLKTIGYRLEVGHVSLGGADESEGNAVLMSLAGLQSLEAVDYLGVGPSPLLPYCAVCDLTEQLKAQLLGLLCEGNLVDSCWDGSGLDCQ